MTTIKQAASTPAALYNLSKNRQIGAKSTAAFGPCHKQKRAMSDGKTKSQTHKGSPTNGCQSRIEIPFF
jgi:hypothetical protein